MLFKLSWDINHKALQLKQSTRKQSDTSATQLIQRKICANVKNSKANAPNLIAKVSNSIAKETNWSASATNSTTKALNFTANVTNTTAKLPNSTANGMKSTAKVTTVESGY